MSTCCIIIPCYNEANRIQTETFCNFVSQNPNYNLLFVNDGSTDDTINHLKNLAQLQPGKICYIENHKNIGKAETVRNGVLYANQLNKYKYIGFLDADLATPITEIPLLFNIINNNPCYTIVFGSRIKRFGANIKRKEFRHYLSRLFVTFSNLIIDLGAYDSQCGAKIFNADTILQIFNNPFVSNWLFDIEIIMRADKSKIFEMPLNQWSEIEGSKIKLIDFLKAPFELFKIRNYYKNN